MVDETIERSGARVLLVDAGGRVLLLHGVDPGNSDDRYWITVGGGLEPGESDRDGAVRELFEETGLRVAPAELVGPVHHEVAEFPFDGRWYRQTQVFFLHRVDTWTVDTSGFEPIEIASIDAWRWWSAEELRASSEDWYPAELPDLLDRLLGNPGATPSVDSPP